MQETWVRSLSQEDPLEREMAIYSSILAWRMSWTEEPDSYRSWGHKSQTRFSDYLASTCYAASTIAPGSVVKTK